MRGPSSPGRLAVAAALSAAMAFGPVLAPAASAWDAGPLTVDVSQIAGPETIAADAVPEWANDPNAVDDVFAQQALPASYDLRSLGVTTPPKFQNPWSSCWAFGGISAAEISILSDMNSTYAETDLDLSERHLTYFALRPITENVDPSQVGEGMSAMSTDKNAEFNAGGQGMFITTLFSQGVGPLPESAFPYRGEDENGVSHSELDDFDANPDEAAHKQIEEIAQSMGMTYDQFLETEAANRGLSVDETYQAVKERIRTRTAENFTYSTNDDWSIPDTNETGDANRLITAGFVLKNGNILPEYWNDEGTEIDPDSQKAIKQELLNGRGVSIMYSADQSDTYTMSSDEGGEMYNQYTYGVKGVNHGVCVVGWDDNYSASNFKTPPPADGAWICKNSWGCTSDPITDDLGNVANHYSYGAKNDKGEYTGYFYLSYYDSTIKQIETMEFSSNLGSTPFVTLQYDYMPASDGFFTLQPSPGVVSTANVFSTEELLEVKSVSSRTAMPNSRVTYAIYELDADAKGPTDGALICRQSQNYEYSGFHRIDLDLPFTMIPNKKYSVVSTVSTVNEDGQLLYSMVANRSTSRENAEAMNEQAGKIVKRSYGNAVVNKGESYFYYGGEWEDWKNVIESADFQGFVMGNPVDNFSIKVYAEPVTDEVVHFEAVDATCTKSGSIEYWYDATNEKYYADAELTQEISREDTVVDALGHDWGEGSITREPTATEPGQRVYDCSRCDATREEEIPAMPVSVSYGAHVQGLGDLEDVKDGAVAGTTGKSRHLEAIWASISGEGSIRYRSHVQGLGWESAWTTDGPSGTKGESRRIEAIQMTLDEVDGCHVWYRVHSQGFGWLGWAHDGETAGTTGLAKHAEAYEVLVLAGDATPADYDPTMPAFVGGAAGSARIHGIGWTGLQRMGKLGTTGQSRQLEALSISIDGQQWDGGISYQVHGQGKGWMDGRSDDGFASFLGAPRRLEAVRMSLDGEVGEHLSVWYRVHSQSFGWLGWAHDGEDAGTCGLSKRAEAVEVQLLPLGATPLDYDPAVPAARTA